MSENILVADVFSFNVKDHDGDVVEKKLTIRIEKPMGPGPEDFPSAVVREKGLLLGDGSNRCELQAPEGYTIQGVSGAQYGAVANNNGVWTYTLSAAVTHRAQGEDSIQDVLQVVLHSSVGLVYRTSMAVEIIDDIPAISLQEQELTVFAGDTLEKPAESLFWGYGADGPAESGALSVNGVLHAQPDAQNPLVATGTYGELTLRADGSYVYAQNLSVPDSPMLLPNILMSTSNSNKFAAYPSNNLTDYDNDDGLLLVTTTNPPLPTNFSFRVGLHTKASSSTAGSDVESLYDHPVKLAYIDIQPGLALQNIRGLTCANTLSMSLAVRPASAGDSDAGTLLIGEWSQGCLTEKTRDNVYQRFYVQYPGIQNIPLNFISLAFDCGKDEIQYVNPTNQQIESGYAFWLNKIRFYGWMA